jgi:hypothetical protein
MVSSKTLKMFVQAHERKLNAKVSGIQAARMEADNDAHASTLSHNSASDNHWGLREADMQTRRRPKSRYFNFILTSTHQ